MDARVISPFTRVFRRAMPGMTRRRRRPRQHWGARVLAQLFNRSNNRSRRHLTPARHFAPEVVSSLANRLDHDVEADGLELFLRLPLPQGRIDLRGALADP